jgi:hypothetical protein
VGEERTAIMEQPLVAIPGGQLPTPTRSVTSGDIPGNIRATISSPPSPL